MDKTENRKPKTENTIPMMSTCASCNTQSDKMLLCGRCKSVNYCNRECQVHHWKHGGHKKACGLATSSNSSSKAQRNVAPPTSAPKNSSNTQKKQPIDEDEPVHPCPICLEQEDMFGNGGMCFTCGQMTCGNCSPRIGALDNCPTCRAPLHSTPEDEFKNCVALVQDRSVGRHTPMARYNLGVMYQNGHGVEQNYAKAVEYYQIAADQGNANAQSNLGAMYGKGVGVEPNSAKAVEYYRLAADQGYAHAQCNLGAMYAKGTGVARNNATALKWIKLAALQNNPTAQAVLANVFFSPETRIEIEGLKSDSSLNGSIGTVAKHLNPEQCSVTVDSHKKAMSVRYTNLNLVI